MIYHVKTTAASLVQYTNIQKSPNDLVNAIFCLGPPCICCVMAHKTIMKGPR